TLRRYRHPPFQGQLAGTIRQKDRPANPLGMRQPASGPRAAAISRRFAHAPEEGKRPFHNAGDILSPGLILQEETGWRLDHGFARGFVEPADCGFFLIERLGIKPGRYLRFHFGNVRPAEPSLVAICADEVVVWIEAFAAG